MMANVMFQTYKVHNRFGERSQRQTMCLFRCYADYTNQTVGAFDGITIDVLRNIETLFEVNIIVYKLSEFSTTFVRRSLDKCINTISGSLCFRDIKSYSHSYMCSKYEDSWIYPVWLQRHALAFRTGVCHVYNGS